MVTSLDLSSDHSPSVLTLIQDQAIQVSTRIPNRRTNWLKYKKYISSHLNVNNSLKTEDEIQSAINSFTTTISNAAQVSTPAITQRLKNQKFPNNIQDLIKEKRKLRRLWQLHRSPALKTQLNQCQRILHNSLKDNKESSLKEYLQNLDPSERSDYSLWKATHKLKRPIGYEFPIRLTDGNWARSPSDKVKVFADHLENVFTPNCTNSDVEVPLVNELVISPMKFRFSNITSAVKNLNTKKSPGIDKISSKMLCELPNVALRLILFIFNAILRIGYYPSSWKMSEIIMIPKPGKDASQVSSYRPISLLSILSKLFEKIFLYSLMPHLNTRQIIPAHQFGFRRGHSTIEQVHRIVTLIRNAFEEKLYCSSLFIDISQAFDKVWHKGLLYKIYCTLPPNTHKILKSYLSERQFVVKFKNAISSPRNISAGVPQGSILGPLLYIIYTADMPTNSLIHTSTFADDTAFVSTHKDPTIASHQLQSHIYILEKWLTKWKIKVNPSKCAQVTFTLRRGNCPNITINNTIVPEQSHIKYLGIHLDRRLTWSHHIESKSTHIKLKTIQLLWLLNHNSTLKLDYKVLIYKAIIKPIWTYGIQLWGTASSSNVDKLQRRQSKILRLITDSPWFIRNDNIHNDLSIPTVRDEIKKFCSKYVQKLSSHPNLLAQDLLLFRGHSRLKRVDTMAIAQTY